MISIVSAFHPQEITYKDEDDERNKESDYIGRLSHRDS
jgi:hypothetical protein